MRRRRVVLMLAGLAAFFLWRRVGHRGRVDVVYDDGSLVRLDRGVETDDLLDDMRALLAILG